MYAPRDDLLDELVAVLTDDIADTGIVDAVQNQVDHLADDEHSNQGIHGALIPFEYERIGCNDHNVHDQDKRSKLDMRMALTEEFGHDIYAAGRRADIVDHAEPRALDHTADDAGKHRIVRSDKTLQRKDIYKKSRERNAGKRAEKKIEPEMPPCNDKQWHVHHECQHTDRQRREHIDNHRDTDEPAGDDRIGEKEKLKPDGIDRRAKSYHEIFCDILQRFFLFKTVFDRIHIIHPSAKAAALLCLPALKSRRPPAGCVRDNGTRSGSTYPSAMQRERSSFPFSGSSRQRPAYSSWS